MSPAKYSSQDAIAVIWHLPKPCYGAAQLVAPPT